VSLHSTTPPDDETVVHAAVLAERRARRAELGEDQLKARAADAERAAVSLERRLSQAEAQLHEAAGERDDLAERLAESERALTVARQQSFADEQARIDAEDQLVSSRRERGSELDGAQHALDAARERVAELERELEALHGQLEEQELVAGAEIVLLQHELDRRLQVEATLRARFGDAVAEVERAVAGVRDAARAPVAVTLSAPRLRPAATPPELISDLDRAAERLRVQVPAPAPAEDVPEVHRGLARRLAGRLRKTHR
jgi:hypothetical protein